MGFLLGFLLFLLPGCPYGQHFQSSLTFQTERTCVNSNTILLDGDSLTFTFEYGYPQSLIDTLECFRERDLIVSYLSGIEPLVSDDFRGRTEFGFYETGSWFTVNASVKIGDNDRATFKCNVATDNGQSSAYTYITSMQYGDVTEEDVASRIKLLHNEMTTAPCDSVFYTETGSGLFDCIPTSIINVTSLTGSLLCTGVTFGSNSYCNFTIEQEDVISQESQTVRVCATLYDTGACKEFVVLCQGDHDATATQSSTMEKSTSSEETANNTTESTSLASTHEDSESAVSSRLRNTPARPTSSSTTSKYDRADAALAFLAIPGGIIVAGLVIGVIFVVANSSKAGSTTAACNLKGLYSGAYQGLCNKAWPYYGEYDYISSASVYYDPVSKYSRA